MEERKVYECSKCGGTTLISESGKEIISYCPCTCKDTLFTERKNNIVVGRCKHCGAEYFEKPKGIMVCCQKAYDIEDNSFVRG
jgi:hypothetical protein